MLLLPQIDIDGRVSRIPDHDHHTAMAFTEVFRKYDCFMWYTETTIWRGPVSWWYCVSLTAGIFPICHVFVAFQLLGVLQAVQGVYVIILLNCIDYVLLQIVVAQVNTECQFL
eukprot:TRINITY_DN31275_c0_g2_i1.p3 TRINITY_DN31275_c0_g2~~TRINITY_DN31275_c0_g2_i1.p3  ORF type:complete len:113 (+),score=4.29 TRINITY_DN31275_c0_g2_i1:448-786(+)